MKGDIMKQFHAMNLYSMRDINDCMKYRLENEFKCFESVEEAVIYFKKYFAKQTQQSGVKNYDCIFCLNKNPTPATNILSKCGHLCCDRCKTLFESKICLHCREPILSITPIKFDSTRK